MFMRKPLNSIYLIASIDGVVNSLVGIFVPIYLLSIGYTLSQVFWYFLYYAVFIFLGFYFTVFLARGMGLRTIMFLRLPFFFLFLLILRYITSAHFPLVLLALVNTVQVSFFWVPMHTWFAYHSDSGHTGNDVGGLFAWPQVGALIAPLVGGAIAASFGFKSLFFLAIVIECFSIYPLIHLPHHFPKADLHWSKFTGLFKKYPRYILWEIGENIREELEGIIWPIFIYLVFRDIFSVGVVGSLIAAGGIFFTFFVGRWADKTSKHRLMIYGMVLTVIIWSSRFLIHIPSFIYYSTLVSGLAGTLILIPLNSYVYKYAKAEVAEEFIVFRELPIALARAIVYSLALLAVSDIRWLFLLVIPASALLYMRRDAVK